MFVVPRRIADVQLHASNILMH